MNKLNVGVIAVSYTHLIYSVASVAALRSSKPTNVLGISSLYSQQFTNGIVLFNEHKMSFSNWLRAVSYTHLDVYKRQVRSPFPGVDSTFYCLPLFCACKAL